MELNKGLRCLIERACSLHDRLNCEIEQSIKFCRFCSKHGRFCDVADQIPFDERERLIVVRDSLKGVEDNLFFLQKLECCQMRDRDEALSRLEESRMVLIDLVRRFQGKTSPDVLRELNACFGKAVIQNLLRDGEKEEEEEPNILQNRRWIWPKALGNIVLKLLIFSATASISYMVSNCTRNQTKHLYSVSTRKTPPFLDSTEGEINHNLFNVFHGKG
ncbi:hypothetical protein CsatB_011588 [Cannabis sativa]|uniref:Uncharacterized protein n=1 Tax=Cannabis sativa TaxID=3483 RepID=A0A7J6HEI4_CANSA|nr:uncharacterized protein LOC115706607 [Cannabis sativa]KAF4393038.1 hypothetical protein G4B88_012033 [Cannabis sativa]